MFVAVPFRTKDPPIAWIRVELALSTVNSTILPELVYLSLGSNVGDRAAYLRAAIERLAQAGTVTAMSGLYETEPVGFRDQPWFLNCAVALETGKTPRDLLAHALAIEEGMGRRRVRDKGPRIIDIDIVLFGDRVIDEPGLRIPHPAMHERRFVLEPLAEIAPAVLHPTINKTVRQLLAELPSGQPVRTLTPET
jgi:2-amino-4-hydroxy-6-hydroxymethyldihydropteridine diphosphokinase